MKSYIKCLLRRMKQPSLLDLYWTINKLTKSIKSHRTVLTPTSITQLQIKPLAKKYLNSVTFDLQDQCMIHWEQVESYLIVSQCACLFRWSRGDDCLKVEAQGNCTQKQTPLNQQIIKVKTLSQTLETRHSASSPVLLKHVGFLWEATFESEDFAVPATINWIITIFCMNYTQIG